MCLRWHLRGPFLRCCESGLAGRVASCFDRLGYSPLHVQHFRKWRCTHLSPATSSLVLGVEFALSGLSGSRGSEFGNSGQRCPTRLACRLLVEGSRPSLVAAWSIC